MILALGASTKSTGYAIFDDLKLINYGCLTASSTDVIKRIQKIIKELNEKVLSKYDIEKVIIEEVRPEIANGVNNLRTHKVLMWLQAALEFLLHEKYPKTKIEYVYPSEWRKACGIHTGRGVKRNSLKEADIDFVEQTYNIKVNDDEADAIGIGHAYINNLNNEINWE